MRIKEFIPQQFDVKMAAKRSGHDPEFDYFTFNETAGSGTVPAFLSKLWILVEDPSNNEIICWDSQGTSFHIYDQSRFAADVLPFYFKHNNISSFVRQLNMYGFRKVPNMEHGGLKVERDDLQFQHPCFVRGREELLERIKRKTGQTKTEQRPVTVNPDSLAKMLTEVNQIKSKQDSFNNKMEDLKRENQILWREVIKLTKMYQQQQHIINKLMHFLMSLVNTHGRGMPGLSRKRPLMINAPDSSVSSEAPPAKKANIVVNNAGDHDYTVQSPADLQTPTVPNTSGVVIQELLDHLDPSINPVNIQTPDAFNVVSPVPAASATNIKPPSVMTSTSAEAPPMMTTATPQFLIPESNMQVMLPNQLVNSLFSQLSQPAGAMTQQPAKPVASVSPKMSQPVSSVTPQLSQPAASVSLQQPVVPMSQQQPQPAVPMSLQPVASETQEVLRPLLSVSQQLPVSSVPLQPLPSAAPMSQQLLQQVSTEPITSQEIALRGIKDQPLSSSSSCPSAKDISEQMKLLQCDLDNVREVLSSGQFSLDPNFILGSDDIGCLKELDGLGLDLELFDPETPLPVSIDASLVDLLSAEGDSADVPSSSVPAQLPAASTDTVSGHELSPYLPGDQFPSLFDELDAEVPPSEEDHAHLFFGNEDIDLNTPGVVDTKPNLSKGGNFAIEDLD